MPALYTTDVPAWIPAVVSSEAYDRAFTSELPLSRFARAIPDLDGRPGDRVTITTEDALTPADNLAENVAAVDEKIAGSGVTVTIKEAVKSVAWSDRVKAQSVNDPNVTAGRKLGAAMADRIELDLGAALLSGRNTAADTFLAAGAFNLAALRAMRARIPAGLRRRGVEVFTTSDVAQQLYGDPLFLNAAALPGAANDVQERGILTRPLFGIEAIHEVDEGSLANVVVGANPSSPPVVMAVRGVLLRAMQKDPAVEPERDARARLSRLVGTALHGEGVVDSRGVVLIAVGQ